MKKRKVYNIPQAAEIFGVHERSVRYWIRKKRITPHYDCRNYPVFTPEDIKDVEKWRNTLRRP